MGTQSIADWDQNSACTSDDAADIPNVRLLLAPQRDDL